MGKHVTPFLSFGEAGVRPRNTYLSPHNCNIYHYIHGFLIGLENITALAVIPFPSGNTQEHFFVLKAEYNLISCLLRRSSLNLQQP